MADSTVSPELLLSALAGISGAVLGASTALASVWLAARRQERLEERKWSLEARTRFHDLRRQLYAEFLSLSSSIGNRAVEVALYHGASPELRSHSKFAELTQELKSQTAKLHSVADEIHLIATDSVRRQAALMLLTVVSWELHDVLGLDADQVRSQAATLSSEYRPKFIAAARAELGIPNEATE